MHEVSSGIRSTPARLVMPDPSAAAWGVRVECGARERDGAPCCCGQCVSAGPPAAKVARGSKPPDRLHYGDF